MRNRIYEFFKEKYALDGIKQDNRTRLENAGFMLGTTLKRNYLTGRYATLTQVNEESAQYGVMDMEVNTHIHGIDRQHCVDAIKKKYWP